MLWKRSLLLFLILVIVTMHSSGASGNETKHHSDHHNHHHKSSTNSKTSHPGPNQLMQRKMDPPNNRQGLLAGPLFLGLSSLLFPVLPMLLLAPIAVAGLGPAVNFVQDALGTNQGAASSNAASSANNEAFGSVLHSLAQSNSGISHALQSLAQRGSAATGSQGAGSSSSLSSLASSLGGGSGGMQASSNTPSVASPSSISSVAQALGISDSALSSSDSSSILNGITNFFGPDRNSPAGSSSLTQTLLGNLGNRPSLLSGLTGKRQPGSAASLAPGSSASGSGGTSGGTTTSGASATPADYLGAAAAALDNAGLLGSISGAGTGSVTDRLLSLVTGYKNSHQQSGALASGSSTGASSALADLLGLGSSTGGAGSSSSMLSSLTSSSSSGNAAASGGIPSHASASSSSSSQQPLMLGSSLSSNIIHNLPPSYGTAYNNMKLVSAKPVSPSSGSIQSLANNALNKISSFIFSRRRSEWIPRPYPGFGYLDSTSTLIDNTSAKVRSGMSSYIRDAYSILKDGIKRYEVAEPECQARIVCELHQRPVGRSFKSWANTLLDIMGAEEYLDSMKFGARTKSVMKDIYRAAKNGMIDKNCAEIYSKCPVSISVEPLKNTLFNKMLRGSGHNIMTGYNTNSQQQNHENVGSVYGPSARQPAAPQSRESADVSPPAATAPAPDKIHNKQQPAVTSKLSTSRPSTSSAATPAVTNRLSSSSSTTKSQSTRSTSESEKSGTSHHQKAKSRRSIANARFASRFSS